MLCVIQCWTFLSLHTLLLQFQHYSEETFARCLVDWRHLAHWSSVLQLPQMSKRQHRRSQVILYLVFCMQDRLSNELLKHVGNKICILESKGNIYEGVYSSCLILSESKESLKICM